VRTSDDQAGSFEALRDEYSAHVSRFVSEAVQ
jgi:hypothetical protein